MFFVLFFCRPRTEVAGQMVSSADAHRRIHGPPCKRQEMGVSSVVPQDGWPPSPSAFPKASSYLHGLVGLLHHPQVQDPQRRRCKRSTWAGGRRDPCVRK